jgi:hypothetical protein
LRIGAEERTRTSYDLRATGSVLLGSPARDLFENVVRQELFAGRKQLPLLESNVVA